MIVEDCRNQYFGKMMKCHSRIIIRIVVRQTNRMLEDCEHYSISNSILDKSLSSYKIGVARIFDWGETKPQIARNDVIRNFERGIFYEGKNIVE